MGARSINRKHGLAGIKRRQPVANPARRNRKHKLVAKRKSVILDIRAAKSKLPEIA